jgi:hypothetical protein
VRGLSPSSSGFVAFANGDLNWKRKLGDDSMCAAAAAGAGVFEGVEDLGCARVVMRRVHLWASGLDGRASVGCTARRS